MLTLSPWRRRESTLPSRFDFGDLVERFWSDDEGSLTSHLPELFRRPQQPAVNVAETETAFCITMDCPGMAEGDFQVQTMGHQLQISGERKWELEKKDKEFHRVESQFGRFERTIALPPNARTEADLIDAEYKQGVLTVTVPKVEKTPTSKITVRGG